MSGALRPGQHVPAVGSGLNTQGMIAPSSMFVDSAGVLNPLAFRFLFNLLKQINVLEGKVGTLQATVAAMQAPPTSGTP